jgi:valyl-tRNA synthetase
MDKAYEPQKHENDIYEKWESSGAFQPSDSQKTFTIPIPPPNVTGTLHAGHSLFITLQDILIRWHRMMGDASLWVPGTDHAAIATESVVLKNLGIEDRNKEISREDFMKEAEKWTKKTHARITEQIKKMGASCDWTREAYTFDKPRNKAVITIFQMLYDKGLIYRGNRLINWSIGAQSVLADDEVEWGEKSEPFYYIRCGEFIIGTVRPETKCADSPVVLSETGRYVRVKFREQGTRNKEQKEEYFIMSENLFNDSLQRKKVLNLLDPLGTFEVIETFTGKELEGREFEYETYAGKRKFVVLADDEVIDMEKGAGAMTISPCHSADDYDLAKRKQFDDYWFQKLDFEGSMTSIAGPCAGMNVNVARKRSAKIMKEQGLLVGEDTGYSHRVPVCYRSHTVVEPMVSKQWFIAVEKEFVDDFSGETTTLKKQMQEAVRGNHVEIVPNRFEKTYFHWIDNLRDWCISRQIWWGHRIPVWYDENDEVVAVGVVENPDPKWRQDEDTLDTWFSSATWPFSIFGWPEKTEDFDRFYPTSILETGHDILFFWVARMIMFGKFATGKYPFKTVYLHGLVCDEKGQKMSKSKGNGIDPLEIIEEFGTDALRLSLVMGTTPGNNSNMGKEKIAGCRNFCNKLWNISRFILSQQSSDDSLPLKKEGLGMDLKNDSENLTDLQKWLLNKAGRLEFLVTEELNKYYFGSAAELLWDFTWNDFADWALEAAKAEKNPQTNMLLLNIHKRLLRLWHPFVPFVTEKIWEEIIKQESDKEQLLITEKWPLDPADSSYLDIGIQYADNKFHIVKEVVSKIRSMRKLAGVDPTKKITAFVDGESFETLEKNAEIIKSLARLEKLEFGTLPEEKGASDTAAGFTVFLPSSGMIDPEAEKARAKKELEKSEKMLAGLKAKLGNEGFVKQAPKELVEKSKQQVKELEEKITVLKKEA